jgi:hypothetical protein
MQKVRVPAAEIHTIIQAAIDAAQPMTINREAARDAVLGKKPEARQEDIDACFQDGRYDGLVRRRKGPE